LTPTGALRAAPGAPATRTGRGGYLLAEHREYLAGIERQMAEWGLADHFHYAGAPDRAGKIALLQSLDVMSMPATYVEPKGFTLLEAMANGVPVVEPRHGAFVERSSSAPAAGCWCRRANPDALADALFTLLTDRDARCRARARRRRRRARALQRRSHDGGSGSRLR
jgi:glycosyltransferase involved in cell wall biosynthesis